MSTFKRSRRPFGFVLIEALIALLLISVGLIGVSKLQALSISGAGDAKARSEAMALSQSVLEQLRNILIRTNYTGTAAYSVTPPWGNSPTLSFASSGSPILVTGTNAVYTLSWTVAANGSPEARLLRLATTWTDRTNTTRRIDLSTLIAWDDPGAQAKLNAPPLASPVTPTGAAKRNSPNTFSPGTGTANSDGTRLYTDGDNTTYLLKSDGSVLLYLQSKNGTAQAFTTITGKIVFDQNEPVPPSANVRVRLSSEGECVFDNTSTSAPVPYGVNSYTYFTYTCYVGPGWYGNVGVIVDDSVNGPEGSPTICVGDPDYNGGISDNTLISPNSAVSGTRSYRGFKGTPGAYFSTGTEGGRLYGLSYQFVGNVATALPGPFDGRPRPSDYVAYGVAANSSNNYFNQDFLLTHITGQQTCKQKMAGASAFNSLFTRNVGKYVCINPDNDPAADTCPSIWPGFESQVGSGNGVVLTVVPAGTGTGTVTSAPAGIDCGSICLASFTSGASVTLTAAPGGASTFAGWSGGGCSGTGTCTVTLSAATSVTATFNSTASFALTVVPAGNGSGTVTSAPSGIACGATCTYSFGSGTSVTLSAAPSGASTFTGWSGGGCSGTGTCTVTLGADISVTATFDPAPTDSLTVTKAGSGTGTVSSSPAGINSCATTCTAPFTNGTSVALTPNATGGSTFTGWGGACSGTTVPCNVTVSGAVSVTATFTPPVVMVNLTVTKAGTGAGTVSSSPSGINSCGATCTASFASGSTVTLTATASSGGFTGWGGACTGTGSCVVTLSSATSVWATFGVCNTPVSGSAVDKHGSVTVTPSSVGICNAVTSTAGYSCDTLTAPAGTQFTLTNVRTSPSYSWPRQVLANCTSQIINFPTGP